MTQQSGKSDSWLGTSKFRLKRYVASYVAAHQNGNCETETTQNEMETTPIILTAQGQW